MILSCNCDMPIEIYCDWLQDQGWDTDELRDVENTVSTWSWYGCGRGWGSEGNGGGFGRGTEYGYPSGYGYGYGFVCAFGSGACDDMNDWDRDEGCGIGNAYRLGDGYLVGNGSGRNSETDQ